MRQMLYRISESEYDKAQSDGAYSIIGEEVKSKYDIFGARVYKVDDEYYLAFTQSNRFS